MAENILIAEDDANIAELVKIILEAKGYITDWAKDGEEALNKAQEIIPDLILLDVMMPRLNGYEVLKALKENAAVQHIPVIFLTVKGETDSKVVGLRMGGHDYITKPFDLDELIARVEAALRIKGEHDHLRDVNNRLAELSMTDPLTSLYNKRYLMERFREEIERAKRYHYPIACLKVAINKFKPVNDQLGELQTNQILQQIALIMKNSNRVVDIIARLDGPEFLLILPQTDLGGAETVAGRLKKIVEETRFIRNMPDFTVTISLGASAYATDEVNSTEELLATTEFALAETQKLGDNQMMAVSPKGMTKP